MRKIQKIPMKNIGINARTIQDIEKGRDTVSLKSLRIYLKAIGLKLMFGVDD